MISNNTSYIDSLFSAVFYTARAPFDQECKNTLWEITSLTTLHSLTGLYYTGEL